MVDAGTGDGRYSLHVARTRADTLVIGVDASADALAYASRRAVRHRLPNLVLQRRRGPGLACVSQAWLLPRSAARPSRAVSDTSARRDIARTDVDLAHSSLGKAT
ncbi:MAG: class I SAM-dependent methyltransferase [Chloroflexi bacterium]|nr:MAG: class I SAM-dependent methyltransferase [Chloroflexota bacterium]